MVQALADGYASTEVLNPYTGSGHVKADERARRKGFRTDEAKQKLESVVKAVESVLLGDR